MKSRNPVIEFDKLQMYFGEPYVIDVESAEGVITLLQPSIGDIIRIGENRFYSTLNIFTTNTTSYRLPLWEIGVDWNIISDFQLFTMLFKNIDSEVASLLFSDLDFSKFELYEKKIEDSTSVVLYDNENHIEITEEVYYHISQYFRSVFSITLEEKITKDDTLKRWYIKKDKRDLDIKQTKKDHGEDVSTSIQPVVSALVNHPGFKYKLKELKDVGVCEFYDSVKRLQVYEHSNALLHGMMGGFVDGSKIKQDDYDFMRKI